MKSYTCRRTETIVIQLVTIAFVWLMGRHFLLSALPYKLVNPVLFAVLGVMILLFIWQHSFSLKVNDKGLIVKRWNFRTINIPWSEIKEIKFQRFPIFGPPRVTLFLPLRKSIFSSWIDSYEELLASIYRYTKIEPNQRVRKFIEKSRARKSKIYRPLHRVLGVLYFGLALSFFLGIQRTLNFGGFDKFILITYGTGLTLAITQYILLRRKTAIDVVYYAAAWAFLLLLQPLHVPLMIFGGEALSIICLTIACAVSILVAFVSLVFFMNWRRWVVALLIPSIFAVSTLTWYYQVLPKPDYKEIATIPGMIIPDDITWSPDGELILARTIEEKVHILSSSGDVKFSGEIPNFTLYPAWSPDSSMIAVKTRDKETKIAELFIYDNRLQNRFPVFQTAKGTPSYHLSFGLGGKDHWNPNSRYLLFSLKQEKGRRIYLFDTVAKKLKVLADNIQTYEWPFWFSNNKIGFLTYEKIQKCQNKYTLWSIDINSKERKQIYKSDKIWPRHQISPNKEYIFVYNTKSDPVSEAYLINLKSKAKNTVFLSNLQDVSWNEDSNFLTFVVKKNNKSELFKFDVLKNELTNLIKEEGEIRSPRWSASGERICYFLEREKNWGAGIFSISEDGSNRLKIRSPSFLSFAGSFRFTSPWSPKEDVFLIPVVTPLAKKEVTFKTIIYTVSFKQQKD